MTRRIVLRAAAIILASFAYIAIIVSAEDESAHEACLSYAISSTGHLYMHVYTDARGTTLDRWDKRLGGTSHVDTTYYAQLHPPAAGTGEIAWPEGVQLAENMRAKGRDFWVTSEPTTSATWEHAPFSREDIWRFNTSRPRRQSDAVRVPQHALRRLEQLPRPGPGGHIAPLFQPHGDLLW
jgi:hypothetical protein